MEIGKSKPHRCRGSTRKIKKRYESTRERINRIRKERGGHYEYTEEEKSCLNKGRPIKMTKECIDKLFYVFSRGGTDKEACFYAEIGSETLYSYQAQHAGFFERKQQFKANPIWKAREIIFNALDRGDESMAKWFLERKKKDEFSLHRSEINIHPDGIIIINLNEEDEEAEVDEKQKGLENNFFDAEFEEEDS